MNLRLFTLGGKQFWTDVRIDDGWRVQRHALTGHYRLLDPRNRRRAWGSEAHCIAEWQSAGAPQGGPESRTGREAVILLHGLGRTRAAMRPLAGHLRSAGFVALDFGYASSRQTVQRHADALACVVAGLAGYDKLHFVGHSLGNLVVRRFLHNHPESVPPAIGRVVMLAPPNNGSRLAARLRRNPAFRLMLGPAGQEIAEWQTLRTTLATPESFAVIAGECARIRNPLLDKAGDLVLTVEETKLAGMSDFRCLDVNHTFLMRNPEVMRLTLSFLQTGRFASESVMRANKSAAL